MISRSLVALSILGAAGLLVACGDSGSNAGGGTEGGGNEGGNNTGAGNTGGENVGAGSDGGNGPDDCGNGTVDAGEDCDGSNLDDQDCESQGFSGGELACSANCTFNTADCTDAVCGDGTINGTEDCDGTLLGGETCQTQGFDSGTLACGKNCSFNTMGCSDISCGDGTINGAEECDGTMLGANTCASEGFDGGTLVCTNCQLDTAGCLNENCTDASDNDGDTLVDCLDTDCATECADSCGTVPVIADPSVTTGTTVGHADVYDAECASGGGGEVTYTVTPAITGVMDITLTSTDAVPADLGVSVWTSCGVDEVDCADATGGAVENLSVSVTAGVPVFIMVEGYTPAISGAYTLDIASRAIVCGDTIVDPGEQCDDGNAVGGDGCSATCQDECGDGTCGAGESSCNCAADCPNSATACEACECPVNGGNGDCGSCFSDGFCLINGDCCANAVAVCGQTGTVTFPALVPPAVAYVGTVATMRCATVNSVLLGNVASVDSLVAQLATSWIGDMVIKLISPDGTVVTIISRPGSLEAADIGGSAQGFGSSDDILFANPVTFQTSAAVSAEAMGAATGTIVCQVGGSGDGVCNYAPNAGAALAGTFASFVNDNSDGNWQLCIGDAFLGDAPDVSTNGATLNFTYLQDP